MNEKTDPGSTEVGDFREILSTHVDGQLPLLVGGHAVNVWAIVYRERLGLELDRWLPLTSKDLDLFGTISLLKALKNRFGGELLLSGPRDPVIGQLVANLGGIDRKIDVLRNVVGLGPKDLSVEAAIMDIEIDGNLFEARVLPVVTLLQAKIANLAKLDQTARNDFKHVNIMLLVVREYLAELITAVESEALDSRAVIEPLEQVRKILTSSESLKCSAARGIQFENTWPRDLLLGAQDPRIQNFVKHRLPS